MQSIHKQTYQSDVGIAVKKVTSVGTVGIRSRRVMADPAFKPNNKISRDTRTPFA